jgi:hypothetical protein
MSRLLVPDASRQGAHLTWPPGCGTGSAPLSACSAWGARAVDVCRRLPHLCDTLDENLEATVGGVRLRGSFGDIRGSHYRRASGGGSPD